MSPGKTKRQVPKSKLRPLKISTVSPQRRSGERNKSCLVQVFQAIQKHVIARYVMLEVAPPGLSCAISSCLGPLTPMVHYAWFYCYRMCQPSYSSETRMKYDSPHPHLSFRAFVLLCFEMGSPVAEAGELPITLPLPSARITDVLHTTSSYTFTSTFMSILRK